MLSSQFFSWTAMKCDLQLNGNILFNSTSEIPMVRSGRKEAATQRIQQMVFSHSEWIPAFCPDLYALINSWIDPSRKHCLLPTWSFKVIAVACSLLGKSEMPWVLQDKPGSFLATKISGYRADSAKINLQRLIERRQYRSTGCQPPFYQTKDPLHMYGIVG